LARRVLKLAAAFVVLHVFVVLTIGSTKMGSFCANVLQITASGIAAGLSFVTRRGGGRGLSRSFWLLSDSVGHVGHRQHGVDVLRGGAGGGAPALSAVRFLFDIQGAFCAMACFWMTNETPRSWTLRRLLDFLQMESAPSQKNAPWMSNKNLTADRAGGSTPSTTS